MGKMDRGATWCVHSTPCSCRKVLQRRYDKGMVVGRNWAIWPAYMDPATMTNGLPGRKKSRWETWHLETCFCVTSAASIVSNTCTYSSDTQQGMHNESVRNLGFSASMNPSFPQTWQVAHCLRSPLSAMAIWNLSSARNTLPDAGW